MTKYYSITAPELKEISRQHVSLNRYRSDDPRIDETILIPQNIGWHVVDENYRAKRTSPPFQEFEAEDLLVELTPFMEWKDLGKEGIDVTDALITVGEIRLTEDKVLKKWRCKPSPLRSSWLYC
jgi:hypothetical protein